MEVVIDLKLMETPTDFYDQLTSQVDFGPFFGRNLDAFWDFIDLLEGEKIIFLNYHLLKDEMNDFFVKIISMINESNLNTIRARLSLERIIHTHIYDKESD